MPSGRTTVTFPVAPELTSAVIELAELTVKETTLTPPTVTAVAPERLVPVIVIIVPWVPFIGVKEVMDGNDE